MAVGSVIKGSTVLIVGRVVGMLGGFVLLMLLSWQSTKIAGMFRTTVTYLSILDFLPLLGTHRWLATEVAHRIKQGRSVFAMACCFAVGISAITAAVYLAIAWSSLYEPETSTCLEIVALASLPSAINLCAASALVGLGYTHQNGLLSLSEMLTRSSLAILLVVLHADLIWVIAVYVGVRWIFSVIGFGLVRSHLAHMPVEIDRSLVREFLSQVPNLALSMIGFLTIRNAGMLLMPLFSGATEAGLYAAPLQFFDLLLLVPTVLTISTNYAFVESAKRSMASLRHSTRQLTYITGIFLLPAVVLGFVLARPAIITVFGWAYEKSILPFRLVLLCAVVVSLDQILSLSMVVSGGYQADRICVSGGALVVVVATCLLSGPLGATGAATALLLSTACTLGIRLFLMRHLVRIRPLVEDLRRQTVSGVLAGLVVWVALPLVDSASRFVVALQIGLGLLGSLIYLAIFYWSGGLTQKRLKLILAFMLRRG